MSSTVRRRGTAKATMCRTCLRARLGAIYNTWRRKRLGLLGKETNAGAECCAAAMGMFCGKGKEGIPRDVVLALLRH
ncbi:hypothetical protein Esi_0083_0001 [Ectocarpus siliculosus]|uniref:Uncharacterized protein n=1 Tax=Ectocarpus siliculosus TaxID=2880 RepID=D7G7F1_ECTSI|nr:hypothetical protein Esi_0083_0001 [Ectocarpus siliculosus]|eukprot:CBJ27693.1 hypothetical protein Esi_0083_0001 [Ectocarpus siliculosus]